MSGIFGYWDAAGQSLNQPDLLACVGRAGPRRIRSRLLDGWFDRPRGERPRSGAGNADVVAHSSDGATRARSTGDWTIATS